MENKIKYIIVSVCIIPILFLFTYSLFQPPHLCNLYTEFKESNYQGIVVDKYIDKENHNTRTIIIKSNEEIFTMILPRDTSSFYTTVILGDTVIKKAGYEFIAIKNNLSVMKFNISWGCE